VIQLLLDNDPDTEIADGTGATALILAAAGGHSGVVKALLEWGVDCQTQDKDGRTAMMWALSQDHADVVDLLKMLGRHPK
jgi:ankyrin repeat protein